MSGTVAAIADAGKLGQVVLYSFVAGVGISIALGLGVSSAASLLDALRERRTFPIVAWGTLASVCVLAITGAIVLGLVTMTTK